MNRHVIALGVLSILAACDADYAAQDEEETDANATASLATGAYGTYGADPASMTFVPGRADYTPVDPNLQPEAIVLGQRRADAARVIATLSDWEGGPLVASAGRDAEAVALAVSPARPAVDHRAETGSWMVAGGRPIIAEGPTVDPAWAARAPSEIERLPEAGDAFVARLPLALERLPEEIRGVIGADVRVFDATREVCIARISGLELEARLVHEPLAAWTPRYSERELLERGLRSVVATLEPLAGASDACDRGVVAVGIRAVSPSLFGEVEVPQSVRRRAVMATCNLSTWRAQLHYPEATGLMSPQCRRLAEIAEVRMFETRRGERFVLVSGHGVHAGFRAAGSQLDNSWAYLEDARAVGVMDVHSDGTPELILETTGRAPTRITGLRFAGDLSEPTFEADWTPIPPERLSVGGYAVPDYSVFEPR